MNPRRAAQSVAGRLREACMPADVTGLYRLPEGDRLTRAKLWTGFRAQVITNRRPNGERYVYTGPVLAVGLLRHNSQTNGVICIADPDLPDPTVLSLAVVDSIRGARP